ncbi:Putative amino-acid ABC transporter-binding protein YhdW [Seminavis robusta]|uniref:Amino-acid ABC transporter-binding protein YhdW n=1 Tax=Seminavis robusta TaxID=568900 RepID=A0A9N8EIM9_9STRA|nr:Putative amino-acid ABC transporter-binding protein YhdW [Seminavis robusta]|eukprot:Sro1292_g259970.1 Putative amino-acid ABC transporter-binding protein YhdW (248) ;mRNA; f:4238-4981
MPRATLNNVNGGETGLIFSHPFGESYETRGAPLGPTLESVLERGVLRCGIRTNRSGFARGEGPTYTGLDVDYCHALAAGLFMGDSNAISFIELVDTVDGFRGLADGSLDVFAGAPWTFENDFKEPSTGLGFAFSQAYFYGYSEAEDSLCLATMQDDHDWSSFVYWTVAATVHAEEMLLNKTSSNQMPMVGLFGSSHQRMFRDAILAVGSYADMYERNLQAIVPREGRNFLNKGSHSGPQHYAPVDGF